MTVQDHAASHSNAVPERWTEAWLPPTRRAGAAALRHGARALALASGRLDALALALDAPFGDPSGASADEMEARRGRGELDAPPPTDAA
jgi:hypothetical protein